jgi:iron-sulfur cluster repair protein YtfE (RIC family)
MSDKELYSYLKAFIHQRYPNREKAFTELSLEMKNISISIFFTLTQSYNLPLNESTHDGFVKEFELLGVQLEDRISREERVLFPMYEKSRELKDISS